MQNVSLVFLCRDGEILLGRKKRGFGKNVLNGPGGKAHPGESFADCAIREAREEIGVTIDRNDLQHMAEVRFSFKGHPELNEIGAIYVCEKWEGEPTESDEMGDLKWYLDDELPYESMWAADKYWIPYVLAGKKISADIRFNEDGTEVLAEHHRFRTHL